jgi:hypothetical protein
VGHYTGSLSKLGHMYVMYDQQRLMWGNEILHGGRYSEGMC